MQEFAVYNIWQKICIVSIAKFKKKCIIKTRALDSIHEKLRIYNSYAENTNLTRNSRQPNKALKPFTHIDNALSFIWELNTTRHLSWYKT